MIFQQYYLDKNKKLPDDSGFIGDSLGEIPFEFGDVDDGFVEGLDEALEFFGDYVWETFGCEFSWVQLSRRLFFCMGWKGFLL